MKKQGVRGNVCLAFVVMVSGAITGMAISYAARAQVDTFGDRSEHGNPVDPVGAITYCVYSIERRGHDCENLAGRNFVCANCTRPDCALYVYQNGFNATAGNTVPPDPPCLVGLAGGGGGCETCPAGTGIVIPINPL